MFFSAFNVLPDYSLAVLNADPKPILDSPAPGRIKLEIYSIL